MAASDGKRSGLSLIELLVATAVAGFFILILGQVFIDGWKSYQLQETIGQLQGESRKTVDLMADDIRQATRVVLTYTAPSAVSYTSSYTQLVIQTPAIDSNQDPIVAQFDYIVFRRDPNDSTKVQRLVFPAAVSTRTNQPASQTIGKYNHSLTFSYLNSNNVVLGPSEDFSPSARIGVIVETEAKSFGRQVSRQFNTVIDLRNSTY